ncbi:MAG: hypothetical protein WD851_21625 [Pirellulales bacterium]
MPFQAVSRRQFLWITAAALVMCVVPADAVTTSTGGRQLTLSEQLTFGLQVATKQDKEFVARVVALVHVGVLPRKLVDSTFLWARQKAAFRGGAVSLRPMVYFRPALVLRARRLGIKF